MAKIIMFCVDWRWNIKVKEIPKKFVLVAAPHTSNWDFFYGIIGFWALDIPIKVLIKDLYTKSWYGSLIKKLGGIGVARESSAISLLKFSVSCIKNTDEIAFLVTPEGTRKRVERWKEGFYMIAKLSEVPLVIAVCNYKTKELQIPLIVDPQKMSYEEICSSLESIYSPDQAKYSDQYNKKIF